MKIGPNSTRQTSISTATPDQIVIRGKDLCADLIGKISFTQHTWLLVIGAMPTETQTRALDAALVAIAEHGLVPSVQAARVTYAAAPEAVQGAVAAGLLGCGSVILGAAEAAGAFLQQCMDAGGDRRTAIHKVVSELRSEKKAIPGYGHPYHKAHDPRTGRLIEVARELGIFGEHFKTALLAEEVIPEITGRKLVLNVSGAIPSLLLDAGYPLLGMKGVPILARTASLIAHILEERQNPIGFALTESGSEVISYSGELPDGFVPQNIEE
ncbi:citryl-CoA lyase [Pelagibacterium sp. H642]|uniref:citryl-CoA lyase n=1 Tax=Pelagibacterium sp. H642 TaxID=1881069 RepID=UPI002815B4F5|nr:citryl-CoA lyase [Pelagibacterium sp. H642]WMT91035.1 citryl-CoA lyase [Pelagibacterium sp. H642]